MQRRNLSLLLPLILISVSCSLLSGQTAEQRMQNARQAAFEVATDIGIKNEGLLSEEENCNSAGCYQQFYFSTDMADAQLNLRLSASTRFKWNVNAGLFVPALTAPYIDLYAKQIKLLPNATPAAQPQRGASTVDGVAVEGFHYGPRLALYMISATPFSYMHKSVLLKQNILRISFQPRKLKLRITVTTGP